MAIAQRMGHTDPAVTLRVYGHLFAGAQEELTQRLDELRWAVERRPGVGKVIPLESANRSGAEARRRRA